MRSLDETDDDVVADEEPLSMTFLAATPISVPALIAARSMSPVEIWGSRTSADERGLGALAGAGRPQKNQFHGVLLVVSQALTATAPKRE